MLSQSTLMGRCASGTASPRTLSKTEALSICGSLSRPGKMPGYAYSLPAQQCRIGSFLQQLPRAICAHCYALHGRYVFPAVRRAMEKRLESISDPRWVEAVGTLIDRSGEKHFRWHDSGDLQGLEHLRKIITVSWNLPWVKFWLPTREYQTIEAYRRMRGIIPPNLCIRYSAHLIDGPAPLHYGLPVSTVSSHRGKTAPGAYRCKAARHGNTCGRCRACWDSRVRIVDFPLKWPSPDFGIMGCNGKRGSKRRE
jgi:hypothetical protein